MSKITPEEAVTIAEKYYSACISRGDEVRWLEITPEKLAALIDEVRGVDAEPVGYRWKWDDGILDAAHPLAGWQIGNVLPDIHPANKDHITVEAVYTHPAPSQPAAPVELPVVMNKITPPPAYACIRRASGEDKCSRWCGDSAKCIASPMLEEAKAAIKLRYTGQGAASEPESTNPYRAGSNAALYWQAGHDAAQAAIAAGRKAL